MHIIHIPVYSWFLLICITAWILKPINFCIGLNTRQCTKYVSAIHDLFQTHLCIYFENVTIFYHVLWALALSLNLLCIFCCLSRAEATKRGERLSCCPPVPVCPYIYYHIAVCHILCRRLHLLYLPHLDNITQTNIILYNFSLYTHTHTHSIPR